MTYENMTVAELKDLLREAGLPVSGKKSELVERLNASSVEETVDVVEEEFIDEEVDDFEMADADDDFGFNETTSYYQDAKNYDTETGEDKK